jgi:hypothetical protein
MPFFIATAMKTSNLTTQGNLEMLLEILKCVSSIKTDAA